MPETPRPSEVVYLLSQVMELVGAVRKGDRNDQQGFSFRGIDAVVNAVSPALRQVGMVVVPTVLSREAKTVEVGRNRTLMGHVTVTVQYRFYAPDGSYVDAVAVGEAMDSGDKATSKAMSVAFRTVLLQALALPTDEPDADSTSYERSPAREPARQEPTTPAAALLQEIRDLAGSRDNQLAVAAEWEAEHGHPLRDATDLGSLELLRDELKAKS
jgi:hypothetical protein